MSVLLSLYIVAIAAATHPETACGVTFQVPHSWYAAETRTPQQSSCVVTIRPRNWVATVRPGQSELTSTVRVTVTNEPFARAAARYGFEELTGGAWQMRSEGSAYPARAVAAGAVRGLDVRLSSDTDGYVTLLDDGKGGSVRIESGAGSEAARAVVLSSFGITLAK